MLTGMKVNPNLLRQPGTQPIGPHTQHYLIEITERLYGHVFHHDPDGKRAVNQFRGPRNFKRAHLAYAFIQLLSIYHQQIVALLDCTLVLMERV